MEDGTVFFLNGFPVSGADAINAGGKVLLGFAPHAEAVQVLSLLHTDSAWISSLNECAGTRFESRRGFDHICLHIPSIENGIVVSNQVDVLFASNRLLFFHESHPAVDTLIKELRGQPGASLSTEKTLHRFFPILMGDDSEQLERIEEELAELEDSLVNDQQVNYVAIISQMRKKLLALKRYYEALFDLLEDVEENLNGLLSEDILHMFRLQTNRADRLCHTVLHLRDYVTQVREAYQAQIDISLNKTMKLFTVIAAIFMPLTLLVGWYGMNLKMPEAASPFAYPAIIGISVGIVLICIVYFKKNKWF